MPISSQLSSLSSWDHLTQYHSHVNSGVKQPSAGSFISVQVFPAGFLLLAHEPRLNPSFCHLMDQAFLFLSLLSYKHQV